MAGLQIINFLQTGTQKVDIVILNNDFAIFCMSF